MTAAVSTHPKHCADAEEQNASRPVLDKIVATSNTRERKIVATLPWTNQVMMAMHLEPQSTLESVSGSFFQNSQWSME